MTSHLEKYGPWALVTGASSGIGAEFAHQLAAQGFNLVLVARRTQRLQQIAHDLQTHHATQVRLLSFDLSQEDNLYRIDHETKDLDIGLLVNNAGFSIVGNFLDNDLAREVEMLHVNCRASLVLAHRFGNRMKVRPHSGMIFLSSIASYTPAPPWTHYATTKAYDRHLAECLAEEFRPYHIDVLALCPGGTETEFQKVAGADSHNANFLVRFAITEMTAHDVVCVGLNALGKKVIVIPGWRNWWITSLSALAPRRLAMLATTWVLSRIHKP
jgi:short-subunit dehydrogenase